MGGFYLIIGLCVLAGVSAAKVTRALRKGKARERDDEIQAQIDAWRDENFFWRRRRKAKKAAEKEGQEPSEP